MVAKWIISVLNKIRGFDDLVGTDIDLHPNQFPGVHLRGPTLKKIWQYSGFVFCYVEDWSTLSWGSYLLVSDLFGFRARIRLANSLRTYIHADKKKYS